MVYGLTGYGKHQYGTSAPYGTEQVSGSLATATTTALTAASTSIRAVSDSSIAAAASTGLPASSVGIKATSDSSIATATSTGLPGDLVLFGIPGEVSVYIDGVRYKAFTDINAQLRKNELDTFTFTAYIEDSQDRQFIQEGKDVKIFENLSLLFKGRLENVEYKSSFRAKCEGSGMAVKALNRKTQRKEYTNTGSDEIIKELVTTDMMSEGTIENGPVISIRFDHNNKLRAIAGVANATGYDWYVDQKEADDYDVDYMNFVARQGNPTSQKTFDIGGNAMMVDREKDTEHIANDITMLGRGDGINQLEARVFAASKAKTETTERLLETDTTSIDVNDASQLGADGDEVYVRVGSEVVHGTLDLTNDQVDITSRGVNDYEGNPTETIEHFEGVQVFLRENVTQTLGPYTPANPEAGSSIDSFGVREERVTDKSIVSKPTLEKIADNELRARSEDIFRIQIKATDPRVTEEISIGDTITVKDVTAMNVNDTFRVVGFDIKRSSSDEGTVIHAANRPVRLTERLSEIEKDRDTLNASMQGATNIDSQNFNDNADNTHPLTTKVYVPDDVVAVNKFELVFDRESYRGYVQNSEHSHSFSITIPGHTHTIDAIPDHTHDLGTLEGIMTIQGRVSTKADFSTSQLYTGDTLQNHTHVWPQDGVLGNLQMDVQIGYGANETTNTQNTPSTTVTSQSGGGTTESSTSASSGAPSYGIFEPGTEPSVDVEVRVDGNLVTTVSNVSVGDEVSTPIDLQGSMTEPIPGSHHTVSLTPVDTGGGNGGRSRLNATVFQKVFIESKL